MNTLQRLYDSEINFGIQSSWDGGFQVWLDGGYDGMSPRASEITVETLDEALVHLTEEAVRLYPGSKFAMAQRAARAVVEQAKGARK